MAPVAAAASPAWGHLDGVPTTGIAIVLLAIGVILLIPAVRGAVGLSTALLPAVLILVGLVGPFFLPGGTFVPSPTASLVDAGAAPSSSASAPLAANAAFDAAKYEPISDITFHAYNDVNRSAITPNVSVYSPGVDQKGAFENTVYPLYTVAGSAWTTKGGLLSSYQAQQYGCKIDVQMEVVGYYPGMFRDVPACRAITQGDPKDVSAPDMNLKAIGTFDLSGSASTVTCAAGALGCSYQVKLANSKQDSWLEFPAIKFTNLVNVTIDSVGTGCDLQDISGTKWMPTTTAHVDYNTAPQCLLKISRTAGSADAQFTMTAYDEFQQLKASAAYTGNIHHATASAAKTVTLS